MMIGATQNSRMRVRVEGLHDTLLTLVVAFPVIGTFFPLDTYLNVPAGRSATLVLAMILLLVVGLFARFPQKSIFALKRSWLLIAFATWALVTSRWAEVPAESFTRSGRLFVYALYGIYLAEILPPKRSQRILGAAILISLFASLAAIAVVPRLAASYDARGILGTWRGALGHKNSLGFLAGIGFLYGLIALKTKQFDQRICLMLIGLGALLMVLANSVTAILGTIVCVAILFYVFYVLPVLRDRLVGLIVALLIVVVAVLFAQFAVILLAALGRETTLTGRSDVWAFAHIMIDRNPTWGYGHGAWKFPAFAQKALEAIHFSVPHAHNTWLDLRLQLGLPGFVLGIVMTVLMLRNIVYLLLTLPIRDFILPTVIFVMLGVRSYSETIVVDPALSDMFLLAFSYASFAKLARDERARRSLSRGVRNRIPLNSESGSARRFGAESVA